MIKAEISQIPNGNAKHFVFMTKNIGDFPSIFSNKIQVITHYSKSDRNNYINNKKIKENITNQLTKFYYDKGIGQVHLLNTMWINNVLYKEKNAILNVYVRSEVWYNNEEYGPSAGPPMIWKCWLLYDVHTSNVKITHYDNIENSLIF